MFRVDDLCNKLADAKLLEPDLRHQISLTEHGKDFAKWLIERGHKADFFDSELGSWGEDFDYSAQPVIIGGKQVFPTVTKAKAHAVESKDTDETHPPNEPNKA